MSTPPPHAGCAPVVGTVSPEGSVSVNPTPVSATVLLGFVRVKVSEVVPFSAMFGAPKTLAIDGGATTVMVAVLLVVPVPPLVDVMTPVVLFLTPAVAPVTVTLKVQLLLGAMLPPDSAMVPGAVAVSVPPPQVDDVPLATVSPAGRASVTPIPVSVVVLLLFVMVKVSTDVPFSGMVAASNDLPIVGGATTVMVAVLLVVPVPPSFEVMATRRVVLDPCRRAGHRHAERAHAARGDGPAGKVRCR